MFTLKNKHGKLSLSIKLDETNILAAKIITSGLTKGICSIKTLLKQYQQKTCKIRLHKSPMDPIVSFCSCYYMKVVFFSHLHITGMCVHLLGLIYVHISLLAHSFNSFGRSYCPHALTYIDLGMNHK